MNSRCRRRSRGANFGAFRDISGDIPDRAQVRPETCLRQKFNSQTELRANAETHRNSMKPAAAGNFRRRYVGERNTFLPASQENSQAISAILHFVRKPMDLGFPKEIDQCCAQDSDCNRAWQRIAQPRPVQRRRRRDKHDQRESAQPNAALEKLGVPKGNDSQRKGAPGGS